ncbi:stage 0 sporulation protein, partial [Escherichia coli]|nr:stage 0 sporulation protein [Escherichia coli]
YDVVGVRFKKAGKIYYFDPGDLTIPDGEFVIVETIRGVEFGRVVINKKQVSEHDVVLPLKKVIRIAEPKDKLIVEENKQAASEAYG